MTSAVVAADKGLSVLVIEKSDKFGGTSAISGGGIWIPNNHHFAAKGGHDSQDEALRYILAAGGGKADETKVRAYLAQAPEMIRYLEIKSRVRYAVAEKYPDYYQHLPGALPGGRSLDPELFDTSVLGDELQHLRRPSPATLLMGRISWTARDAHVAMARERGWRLKVLGLMLRYKLDFKWRKKTKYDRRAALGSALVCSLRASLMDRKVPLWLKTDFRELVIEDGRVTGVRVERDGLPMTLIARRGVILGAGGFEQNQALRENTCRSRPRRAGARRRPATTPAPRSKPAWRRAPPPTCSTGHGGRRPSP